MFKALKRVLGFTGSGQELRPPSGVTSLPSAQADPRPDTLRLANVAVQNERYAEAAELYLKHLAADASSVSGYIGLGFANLELGRFADAVGALSKAIALDPANSDGYFLLGRAHLQTGQEAAAIDAWSRAHELDPKLQHLYLEFCLLLFNRGKADQAMALMEAGTAHFPDNADFKFYLGNLLAESGDPVAALACYRRAVELNPDSPGLLSSYGKSLAQVGDLERALDVLKRALELAPDNPTTFSNYLLSLQYSPNFSKEEKFEAAKTFSERFETLLMDQWGNYAVDPSPLRKLRLGYVSGDLRNHALASFFEPILAHHDRSKFEVHCYYNYPALDQVSKRFQAIADHWVECHSYSDQDLADRIRADRIDVLVDLSGHTGYNRLLTFARKPAPVQMTWLGYQATTGLRAMDFRITEEALDPSGTSEKFHSEKLIRLPSSGTFSPAPNRPPVNDLPALTGKPFTFGCLNNPSKITDEAIELWAEILMRSPGARLMIGNSTLALEERLSAQFARRGIDTVRLIFEPKVGLVEYLALHHQIDLALDTFPYNGGTTTFHSISMGVPVVALEGDSTLSKVGAAAMRGMGLSNFCADSKERYVELAVYFSRHLAELSVVRHSLRDTLDRVSRHLAIEVTASLEKAMQASWQDYCSRCARDEPNDD